MALLVRATAIHRNSAPVTETIESTDDIPADVIGEVAVMALRSACEAGCIAKETTVVITFREVPDDIGEV